MEPLKIEPGKDSPQIEFDPKNDRYQLKGICHPENVKTVFEPVFEWLDRYYENLNSNAGIKMPVHFFYKYINSSSVKHHYNLLKKLSLFYKKGINIEVIWNYTEDDDDMKEIGNELSQLGQINIPFRFVSWPEDSF